MTGLWWLSSNPTGPVAALRVAAAVSMHILEDAERCIAESFAAPYGERVASGGAGRVGRPRSDTIVNGGDQQ